MAKTGDGLLLLYYALLKGLLGGLPTNSGCKPKQDDPPSLRSVGDKDVFFHHKCLFFKQQSYFDIFWILPDLN